MQFSISTFENWFNSMCVASAWTQITTTHLINTLMAVIIVVHFIGGLCDVIFAWCNRYRSKKKHFVVASWPTPSASVYVNERPIVLSAIGYICQLLSVPHTHHVVTTADADRKKKSKISTYVERHVYECAGKRAGTRARRQHAFTIKCCPLWMLFAVLSRLGFILFRQEKNYFSKINRLMLTIIGFNIVCD